MTPSIPTYGGKQESQNMYVNGEVTGIMNYLSARYDSYKWPSRIHSGLPVICTIFSKRDGTIYIKEVAWKRSNYSVFYGREGGYRLFPCKMYGVKDPWSNRVFDICIYAKLRYLHKLCECLYGCVCQKRKVILCKLINSPFPTVHFFQVFFWKMTLAKLLVIL